MEFSGIRAIVTGGASGLGAATVRMLAEAGAKVAIFDLNDDLGVALAAEIGGSYVRVNVADDAGVAAAIASAEAAHGMIADDPGQWRCQAGCGGAGEVDEAAFGHASNRRRQTVIGGFAYEGVKTRSIHGHASHFRFARSDPPWPLCREA